LCVLEQEQGKSNGNDMRTSTSHHPWNPFTPLPLFSPPC
jgi:hypothetical protein